MSLSLPQSEAVLDGLLTDCKSLPDQTRKTQALWKELTAAALSPSVLRRRVDTLLLQPVPASSERTWYPHLPLPLREAQAG